MELIKAATNCLQQNLAVQAGETVLVVTDDDTCRIGQALYDAAKALGCEAMLLTMAPRKVSGQEPPQAVAAAMAAADVVICPTAQSLTHTNARIAAVKQGARIATMPGMTEQLFCQGAMTADYKRVQELTDQMTQRLTHAKTARIENGGYSLTLDLTGRGGVPSPGVYTQPGQAGNLPSGEAYIAPLEDGSHGELLIDGSMVGVGLLQEPLYVRIAAGKLREIRGADAHKLQILMENDRNGTVCELGIGTNECAALCGIILEDEKIYGSVHIAFGTNTSFGGTNKADCHMDGVMIKPTLYLDDVLVLQDGLFVG